MNIGAIHVGNGKTRFTVWAPLKEKMALHLVTPFDKKIQMEKDGFGYFHVETVAEPGCRYYFLVEEEKDFPDPASQFQPEGVNGPSEVFDHTFSWTDHDWTGIPFSELILYELHIGTFTEQGTFDTAIKKLDHLSSTGINAIEIMPISQFPGNRNWGYDGVYPYAAQNSYGGPAGLKKLVNACHQKGIAVFLDVVYNHLGPEGNYLEQFGPYLTDHYKTPWGKALNFDGQWSDGVRDFFSENALYWFEHFHLDGLRFDAIHQVYDMGAVHFWKLMHEKIGKLQQKLGRPLYTIAESDFNDPRVINAPELGGYNFTAQWMDDFHHALYALIDPEQGKKLYADFGKMDQLAKAYKDGFVHSGEYVNFRKRKFGTSSAGIPGSKFVVFIDNHDQAGNRLTGDCLSSLITFERLKMASAAYLLSPYIPMLFMGEEYGDDSPFLYFISHGDQELVELVRRGRKKEFGHVGWENDPPDPFDEKTFQRSKLQWSKTGERKHEVIHKWYKKLIHLRKMHPALQSFNKNDITVNLTDSALQLHRRSACGTHKILTLLNFSESSTLPFTLPCAQRWDKVIDSNDRQWVLDQPEYEPLSHSAPGESIMVPPLTVVAYACE